MSIDSLTRTPKPTTRKPSTPLATRPRKSSSSTQTNLMAFRLLSPHNHPRTLLLTICPNSTNLSVLSTEYPAATTRLSFLQKPWPVRSESRWLQLGRLLKLRSLYVSKIYLSSWPASRVLPQWEAITVRFWWKIRQRRRDLLTYTKSVKVNITSIKPKMEQIHS